MINYNACTCFTREYECFQICLYRRFTCSKIGWYGTARISGVTLFSVVLVGVYKMFLSDINLASIGTLSYAASFLLTGLANSNGMLYAGTPYVTQ